jgi:hypothetical protein
LSVSVSVSLVVRGENGKKIAPISRVWHVTIEKTLKLNLKAMRGFSLP